MVATEIGPPQGGSGASDVMGPIRSLPVSQDIVGGSLTHDTLAGAARYPANTSPRTANLIREADALPARA